MNYIVRYRQAKGYRHILADGMSEQTFKSFVDAIETAKKLIIQGLDDVKLSSVYWNKPVGINHPIGQVDPTTENHGSQKSQPDHPEGQDQPSPSPAK